VVSACTTRRRFPARAPRRMTTRKSSLRRKRAAAGNTARPDDGRIRRTASRGPCDGGRPRWRGRRESAYAGGTRESARGDGCSAGRCAYPCSRLKFSWSRLLLARRQACRAQARQSVVVSYQRVVSSLQATITRARKNHPLQAGDLTRVRTRFRVRETAPFATHGDRPRHPPENHAGGTDWRPDVPREIRFHKASCGGAQVLLTCLSQLIGPRAQRQPMREPAGGGGAGRRTLVHSCGQLCGYLLFR
jgi:hypothetical protein